MKNIILSMCLILFALMTISGQQEKGMVGINNWLNNWTEFNTHKIDYGEATQIIAGNITSNIFLEKKHVYLLMGSVFVTNNAVMTIEPGTVIIGDYDSKASLTITRGARLIAEGEATDPIVFTSNRGLKRAGDWGGVIMLGDAPSNQFGEGSVASYYPDLKPLDYIFTNFGGTDSTSNSGILKYVRIEYAGKNIKGFGHFNGLMLAGVGNQTVLENIMISHSAGNSFELLGGEVFLEKVVSFKTHENDFEFNHGAQAHLYNSLAVRSPYVSSSDGSRCLLVKSFDKKNTNDFSKNGTSVIAQNITFINTSNNLKSDMESGLINEAILVGEYAALDMSKSVLSGFSPAVLLDENVELNQDNLEKIQFTSMYFNNCNGNIFTENNSNNDDLENWYGNQVFFFFFSKGDNIETFIASDNLKRPDFRLQINKILASNDD